MNVSRRFVLAIAASALVARAASAETAEQEIVEKSRLTVDALRREPELGEAVSTLLRRARGVMIVPSLLKAGFILGGEGGSGVLLARDANGAWSAPSFFTLGSASVGLQIGAQDSQVIFIIMTENGLRQVVNNQFKLGADASIAIGPIGRGVEAATTPAAGADIYAYSKARGLFGGVSFEGSVVYARADWNRAYYGRDASASEIVMERKFTHRDAAGLIASLR